MSHTIRRRSAIRSLPAIRAACVARGIAESAIRVSGDSVTVDTPLTISYGQGQSYNRTIPVNFNLASGEVAYDADFTASVSAFLAEIVAVQIKQKARKEGHTVSSREVTVKGRKVLRVTVEG